MLYYGGISQVPKNDKTLVYNFNSLNESYFKLVDLFPPNEVVGQSFGREYDINYANYIMQNDQQFYAFINYIMLPLYQGLDVYLIISLNEEWSENMIESLMKLIQQRYGYNGIRINCEEDWLFAKNSKPVDFTRFGVQNLDADRERFSYLCAQKL